MYIFTCALSPPAVADPWRATASLPFQMMALQAAANTSLQGIQHTMRQTTQISAAEADKARQETVALRRRAETAERAARMHEQTVKLLRQNVSRLQQRLDAMAEQHRSDGASDAGRGGAAAAPAGAGQPPSPSTASHRRPSVDTQATAEAGAGASQRPPHSPITGSREQAPAGASGTSPANSATQVAAGSNSSSGSGSGGGGGDGGGGGGKTAEGDGSDGRADHRREESPPSALVEDHEAVAKADALIERGGSMYDRRPQVGIVASLSLSVQPAAVRSIAHFPKRVTVVCLAATGSRESAAAVGGLDAAFIGECSQPNSPRRALGSAAGWWGCSRQPSVCNRDSCAARCARWWGGGSASGGAGMADTWRRWWWWWCRWKSRSSRSCSRIGRRQCHDGTRAEHQRH